MLTRILILPVLLTTLAAAVACSDSGEPTTAATAAATIQPTVQDTGENGISPELAEFLLEVDRRVSEIRGIPVADPVPFRFMDDEAINAYVREQLDEAEVLEDLAHGDAIYTLLGLISPEDDLFELYAALLDAQVLGAYDPEVEEFVVLQPGGEFGPSQEFTYAHEYVHRLQDARFGLDQITDRIEENSDRSLAFTALVEGDATTTQQIYALRHLDLAKLSQILSEAQGAIESSQAVPFILRRGLEFPYVEGASFVDRLRVTQGQDAVDAAFENPPESSEQILHIEKFVNREAPVAVTLPDTILPDGNGWEIIDEDVMGEFFLKAWLQAIGARATDAAEAAAGWGGDATALMTNDAGETALAARIEWDNPELDAEQFMIVLTSIMAASPDFLRLDIGPQVGVVAYEGPGSVIVAANFIDPESGEFTAIAAAENLEDGMMILLDISG